MDIHDPRKITDFQKFTFSGHLRTHVFKVLDENIKLGHADYAGYWSLELLCSGIIHSMWSVFFQSAAQHLNRAAPNSLLYLLRMYEKFAPYEGQYSLINITDMRNNKEVRALIAEVAATLALCRKNKLAPLPRIKVEHDFQQATLHENMKSPSSNYARHLVKQDDPLELYIPLNELCYCLKPESRDYTRACYWISWILAYASQYKKQNKEILQCGYRPNIFVEDKFCRMVVWTLWEIVQDSVKTSPQSGTLNPFVDALFKFHCLRWTPSDLKSRICFLNTAVLFICESNILDIHQPVPGDILLVQKVVENVPEWVNAIIHTQRTFSS